MKTRATVADYDRLRNTGKGLAVTDACDICLWPNGDRRIWIHSADHKQFLSIEVSEGPHGLSVRIGTNFATNAPLQVRSIPWHVVNSQGQEERGEREVDVVQYRDTDQARAFARWYQREETDADVALLGWQYQRYGRGEADVCEGYGL